ncbi:MAG: hypothetical protein LC790_19205 [Actinobacteria bacterium]|nr:hypothetical protein [Actinomycetota bacterium]
MHCYDALLARGDDLRWLRPQRDRIAVKVLHAHGSAAAANAASTVALPLFSQVD